MYRRPRRRRYIVWLAALLAVALVGAAGYGIYKLFTGTPNLDKGAVLLPTPDKESVFPWKDGVLCVYKKTLICNDLKGDSQWGNGATLPAENMKACREGDLSVAWGGNFLVLIDKDGIVKNTMELKGEVVMAVPGVTNYAAVIKEENQHRLRIYSVKDSSQVDEALFPYASVLGMGFFGEKSSQLWTLAVDSHGTQPVTKLNTYYPGKATTGEITLRNEVGYAAVLEDKQIYIVGTHTLSQWEYANEKDNKLIYGWNLQDVLVEGGGKVSFLFSPASNNESGQISSLWYINTSGVQYRIPLPVGCIKAMLKENGRICVATVRGVYSMARDGKGSRFYPLGNTVESIPAVVPGKAFVIFAGHRNYLVMMP